MLVVKNLQKTFVLDLYQQFQKEVAGNEVVEPLNIIRLLGGTEHNVKVDQVTYKGINYYYLAEDQYGYKVFWLHYNEYARAWEYCEGHYVKDLFPNIPEGMLGKFILELNEKIVAFMLKYSEV